MTLIIPWNDLRTKPLKIQVGSVFMLCQPALDHFDLEDEIQRLQVALDQLAKEKAEIEGGRRIVAKQRQLFI